MDTKTALEQFLNTYTGTAPVQAGDSAAYDVQIRNLSLLIADFIALSAKGTILDFGSGDGILLERLAQIPAFTRYSSWDYLPVDFAEKLDAVLERAVKLRLHRRVEAMTVDDFYGEDSDEKIKHPILVVNRNVLHELDIPDTARFIFRCHQLISATDLLIVQDLRVFPESERGNVCWTPDALTYLFSAVGMKATIVEELSSRGNRWFTATVRRERSVAITFDQVRETVLRTRREQLSEWERVPALVPDDTRIETIAILDFDLQRAALREQLSREDPSSVSPLEVPEQARIARMAFEKQLTGFSIEAASHGMVPIERSVHFRDRASGQDHLEAFLLSPSRVAFLPGAALMGKSELVIEVLARRAHTRRPLIIDAQTTATFWNLLEQYLANLGCFVGYEIAAGFKNLRYEHIRPVVCEFITRVSSEIIVCFDHTERLADVAGTIIDQEVRDFIADLVAPPTSKVILTSRTDLDTDFLGSHAVVTQPRVGRFPEENYVEYLLDDFIDRKSLEIEQYPRQLLDAVDRHPFIAVLAARIIKHEGKAALADSILLDELRRKLRTELLRRLVTEANSPVVDIVSLVRIPIPRPMAVALTSEAAVAGGEQSGLLYTVRDRYRNRIDLISGLGVLRRNLTEGNYDLDQGVSSERADRLHVALASWFQRLYRVDTDPRWLREAHFHMFAAGKPVLLAQFGAAYKDEIFWAGDYWFRQRKDFQAALWAFETAANLGLSGYHLEMRLAACLMRVGRVKDGEYKYATLVRQYPSERGIKTSYIDSLLYRNDHARALAKLNEFKFSAGDDPWIAHEFGRAYLGLHGYTDAINAFEVQIRLSPDPLAYRKLALAYLRAGNRDQVGRVLADGRKRHPKDFRLKLAEAAHLIRLGDERDRRAAEKILRELLQLAPSHGGVLQQLCKVLCSESRVEEAKRLAGNVERIYPERFKTGVKIELLLGERRWRDVLRQLDTADIDPEHATGLRKRTYLQWALSEEDLSKRRMIATLGLEVSVPHDAGDNIPVIVTDARLAAAAEAWEKWNHVLEDLGRLNARIADDLRNETDASYWDESPFMD
jgi:Flp pilus assembly protein TadD